MIFERNLLGPLTACIAFLACPIASSHAAQVRLLGWAAVDGDLQFDLDRKPARLSVFSDSFSSPINVEGGSLVLYKTVEHEGAPKKQTACAITIPAGQQRGLLILIPGDQKKALSKKVLPDESGFVSRDAPLIYDYLWLDDSHEARPPGTLEFRNLSRLPIALQIEQQQLMLAPKDKAQVPLRRDAKRMSLRAAAQINGRWRLFRSNPLSTRNPDRMLVVFRDAGASAQDPAAPAEPDIETIALYDWPQPVPRAAADAPAARGP